MSNWELLPLCHLVLINYNTSDALWYFLNNFHMTLLLRSWYVSIYCWKWEQEYPTINKQNMLSDVSCYSVSSSAFELQIINSVSQKMAEDKWSYLLSFFWENWGDVRYLSFSKVPEVWLIASSLQHNLLRRTYTTDKSVMCFH